jgi:DNA-binding transcriptional ArsR family regulator
MPKPIATKKRTKAQLPELDTYKYPCFNVPLVTTLRQKMLSDDTIIELAATFDVLSSPTRIQIIHALSRGELCVCDLAHVLGMSVSAVSHQLRLLRALGLVKYRYEGRMVFYSIGELVIKRILEDAVKHLEGN